MKSIVAPALLAVLGGSLLIQLPMAIAARSDAYTRVDTVLRVQEILEESFVAEITDEQRDQIQLNMISGMIDTLNDDYTTFIPPANTVDFNKSMRGEYVGIGAEVNVIDDYLTIISPMDNSPALQAGVRAGDVVLEINGISTFEEHINDSIDRLMGQPGTPVTIRVRHEDGVEEEIEIIRRHIVTPTVKGIRRNGEDWNWCVDEQLGIAYIRVTQFNANTVDDLRMALDSAQRSGFNGLVLDLRDNPGGALDAAIGVSDIFLESGEIVAVKHRNAAENRTWSAKRHNTLPYFPMAILINDTSASASEIVAGALQDNGRAKVVGTRSFGKGSVQEIRELPYNLGVLKYTAADYYLPSGRNLNRDRNDDKTIWGVDPDPGLVVPLTDNQRNAMYRARRDFEIIGQVNDENARCVDENWLRNTLKDPQLATAVEALGNRLESGQWPAVSDEDAAAIATRTDLARALAARGRLIERMQELDVTIAEMRDKSEAAGNQPLLPENVDLVDGTMTLRDRLGNVIGTYRIEGGDMETALSTVDVEPIEPNEAAPAGG